MCSCASRRSCFFHAANRITAPTAARPIPSPTPRPVLSPADRPPDDEVDCPASFAAPPTVAELDGDATTGLAVALLEVAGTVDADTEAAAVLDWDPGVTDTDAVADAALDTDGEVVTDLDEPFDGDAVRDTVGDLEGVRDTVTLLDGVLDTDAALDVDAEMETDTDRDGAGPDLDGVGDAATLDVVGLTDAVAVAASPPAHNSNSTAATARTRAIVRAMQEGVNETAAPHS